MCRKIKYGIVLLRWKIKSLTRRERHLIGILASALITIVVTRFFVRPLHSTAPPRFPSGYIPRRECKSWKATPQHKTTLITKTACKRDYFLLILVSTAPANLERRNLIRQTWGTDSNLTAPQWKTYFLIAQTANQTHSDLVEKETTNYSDIIRGYYYENYWNQSLKIQMAFEWAARYCEFSFLLKADDDVLVHTDDLIGVLQSGSTPKQGIFMGRLHHKPEVLRRGKWNVTYEEYSHSHYPDFCSGAGFVMSYDVVECLVPLFDVIKPYRMDDVYVGMLAKESGVIAVDHSGFFMPVDDFNDCNFLPNVIVQHRATGQCLIKLLRMHGKDFPYGTNLGSFS